MADVDLMVTDSTPAQETQTEEQTEQQTQQAQETAEQAAQAAEIASVAAAVAAEEAAQQAEEAQKALEATANETSSLKSVVEGLIKLSQVQQQRIENQEVLLGQSVQTLQQAVADLRPTLDLLQEMIGSMDEAVRKLQDATAALILLKGDLAE